MTTRSPRPKAVSASAQALALGAARASGERARRSSTPLLGSQVAPAVTAQPIPGGSRRAATPVSPVAARGGATAAATSAASTAATSAVPTTHRPVPTPKDMPVLPKAASRSGSRATAERSATSAFGEQPTVSGPRRRVGSAVARPTDRRATAFPAPEAPILRAVPSQGAGPEPRHTEVKPGPARSGTGVQGVLRGVIRILRSAAIASGLTPDDAEAQVARTLAFLRRRLTGDYEVDDFGFDEDFTLNAYLPILRPLYKSWFRVEVRGIENIPAVGGGLVVANHSGTVALDSLMTQVAVHDEHPGHRHLRMLGADLIFKTPIFGQVARKSGSTLATNPDAERLLSSGELVGVWPEGFKGVGKPFSDRYKLQRFGRGGFVAAAVRTGAPIIPCSIVGAEEIYPMIGNMKPVARLFGAPYAPVTPTWPLLGPLGLIPLPSKWVIEFGAPIDTASLGKGAAEDAMLIFDLTDQIRETIQQTLYSLLMQRRSVFFS